jgi:hypothetical protein
MKTLSIRHNDPELIALKKAINEHTRGINAQAKVVTGMIAAIDRMVDEWLKGRGKREA